MKKFNFKFKRQDGLTTVLELLGIGLVRAFTGDLIPPRGALRKVTDIAFGAAAGAAVLSYTVPKVTDFVKVNREKKDEPENEANVDGDEGLKVVNMSDYRECPEEQPTSVKQKMVNILSGTLTDTIKQTMDSLNISCIKIDDADPEKEMIFAVVTPDQAQKIKEEYNCEMVTVKPPVEEEVIDEADKDGGDQDE